MSTSKEALQETIVTLTSTITTLIEQANTIAEEITTLRNQPNDPILPTFIAKPTLVTPSDNAVIEHLTELSATQFTIVYSNEGDHITHVATYWEIATDADFTSIHWSSGRVTDALTSINPEAQGFTTPVAIPFYVRVKYESNDGVFSNWSSMVTLQSGINTTH